MEFGSEGEEEGKEEGIGRVMQEFVENKNTFSVYQVMKVKYSLSEGDVLQDSNHRQLVCPSHYIAHRTSLITSSPHPSPFVVLFP